MPLVSFFCAANDDSDLLRRITMMTLFAKLGQKREVSCRLDRALSFILWTCRKSTRQSNETFAMASRGVSGRHVHPGCWLRPDGYTIAATSKDFGKGASGQTWRSRNAGEKAEGAEEANAVRN